MATLGIFCVQKSTKIILYRDFSAFRYPILCEEHTLGGYGLQRKAFVGRKKIWDEKMAGKTIHLLRKLGFRIQFNRILYPSISSPFHLGNEKNLSLADVKAQKYATAFLFAKLKCEDSIRYVSCAIFCKFLYIFHYFLNWIARTACLDILMTLA